MAKTDYATEGRIDARPHLCPLPRGEEVVLGKFWGLERLKKYCSHVVGERGESGLFGFGLRFGSVTGFFKPAPSPKPRPNQKILAPRGYGISLNALGEDNSKPEFQPMIGGFWHLLADKPVTDLVGTGISWQVTWLRVADYESVNQQIG